MRDNYYRNMDGFIFVYSVTDRNSFAEVDDKFEDLRRVRVSLKFVKIKKNLEWNSLVDDILLQSSRINFIQI